MVTWVTLDPEDELKNSWFKNKEPKINPFCQIRIFLMINIP